MYFRNFRIGNSCNSPIFKKYFLKRAVFWLVSLITPKQQAPMLLLEVYATIVGE